jgi:hypothetical protein
LQFTVTQSTRSHHDKQPTAAASTTGAFTITLRLINTPTPAQRAFFEPAAGTWLSIVVGGRQERVAGDVATSARIDLGSRERLIRSVGVVE